MKYFFVLLRLLLVSATMSAQLLLKSDTTTTAGGNTYAIVIGISSYQDRGIPQLNYSNGDAIIFSKFLMSAPGAMNKNGDLICYNTPSVTFVNMGLSIDYLNDVVNTISVQTKAKVVAITDACHSGQFACK